MDPDMGYIYFNILIDFNLKKGANEAVLRMLESIGKLENIPQYLQDVKDRKKLLFGFGHRIYKNYDPRAKIVKRVSLPTYFLINSFLIGCI